MFKKAKDNYSSYKEPHLFGRFLPPQNLLDCIERLPAIFEASKIGNSVLQASIYLIKVGTGNTRILGWSQMHGNETTTTKALFDFFRFLSCESKEVKTLLNTFTFYFIPVLNPDGTSVYSRYNALDIDLNRDARVQTQPETQCLMHIYKTLNPDLCLNLHDQRSIYGFLNGKSAALSFLAPAANASRSLTISRKHAMQRISGISSMLEDDYGDFLGRYDDTYNPNCVGDHFQKLKTPTILIEAGHYPGDYNREHTRKIVFLALVALCETYFKEFSEKPYNKLPENQKNYCDVLIRNVKRHTKSEAYLCNVAIQFEEVLKQKTILWQPYVSKINKIDKEKAHSALIFGHNEIDVNSLSIQINGKSKWDLDTQIECIQTSEGDAIQLFLDDNML